MSVLVSRDFGSAPRGSIYMQQNGKTGMYQPKDIMHSSIRSIVTHAQWRNVILDDNSMQSMHKAC
jgi:hypothetical protein